MTLKRLNYKVKHLYDHLFFQINIFLWCQIIPRDYQSLHKWYLKVTLELLKIIIFYLLVDLKKGYTASNQKGNKLFLLLCDY